MEFELYYNIIIDDEIFNKFYFKNVFFCYKLYVIIFI